MLTNIKLKNFRAFQEDIDVRIRPITILIGRNSAGKSTLIKFLLMLQQTLESSESSEGNFFSTEGRHVSLGTFKDLKNTKSRSKVTQFILNLRTNDLPDIRIQQIREKLQQSKAIPKLENNSIELAINLNPFSTVATEYPLGQATSVKVDSQITANDLIADFYIFGSIPYSGKQAKHTVICKIGGKKDIEPSEQLRNAIEKIINDKTKSVDRCLVATAVLTTADLITNDGVDILNNTTAINKEIKRNKLKKLT